MIFFSSDHHFGHTNIIKYCGRPYATVEEMNEALIKNWNDIVGVNDEVYYLGDFSLNRQAVIDFTPRLNGIKKLIPGNHDLCHSSHKASRTLIKYKNLLTFYDKQGWYIQQPISSLNGHTHLVDHLGEIIMCHFPYTKNPERPQYDKYCPEDNGEWLLHGHVHNLWKVKDKMINVGVDIWDMKPVSLKQIEEVINERAKI